MNHLEQLAIDAQVAVHVMASPDAQEIEFLPLKPRTASETEIQSLASRWPGRGLRASGVLGRLPDGRVQAALKVPFDCTELTALLQAFTHYCEAHYGKPQCDDSLTLVGVPPRAPGFTH